MDRCGQAWAGLRGFLEQFREAAQDGPAGGSLAVGGFGEQRAALGRHGRRRPVPRAGEPLGEEVVECRETAADFDPDPVELGSGEVRRMPFGDHPGERQFLPGLGAAPETVVDPVLYALVGGLDRLDEARVGGMVRLRRELGDQHPQPLGDPAAHLLGLGVVDLLRHSRAPRHLLQHPPYVGEGQPDPVPYRGGAAAGAGEHLGVHHRQPVGQLGQQGREHLTADPARIAYVGFEDGDEAVGLPAVEVAQQIPRRSSARCGLSGSMLCTT